MIEDPYAAEAVHRLEARAHRHDAEAALRATLDRLTAESRGPAAQLDDPAAFTVAPPVVELAQCERCEQPIARYGQHWRHEGGVRTPCPRACPPARTPRDELRELLDQNDRRPPWGASTRYVRGEFVPNSPDAWVASMRVQEHPYPLYARDAAAALGVEDVVGVHVGFRWANAAARWEVCRVDVEGEPVGEWVPVPPRPQTDQGHD
jgi:hypothetical protein